MKKVLLVDDDDSIRKTLRKALEFGGYDVVTAENGIDAIEVLEGDPVDLIITDIFMPDMDGIQFALKLRKLSAGIPFIAMSGGGVYENMSMLEIAGNLGAAATLEKPFDLREFLDLVKEVLEG